MKQMFFRDDDLGWMFPKFDRLLELFERHGAKLCAAAIPMSCLEQLPNGAYAEHAETLEVHVHGLTHLDFEGSGKRAEFGPARAAKSAAADLERAYQITREIFGPLFTPVFTPPWNRIDQKLFPILREAGYRAVSTDGPWKGSADVLPQLNVQIDLHTSKNPIPPPAEIVGAIERSTTPVGVMLHHKHMAEADFESLDEILRLLKARGIETQFMRQFLQ